MNRADCRYIAKAALFLALCFMAIHYDSVLLGLAAFAIFFDLL